MYNQVNNGPHAPMQPAYQQRHQAPPPPFPFPQGSSAPSGQHVPNAVPPHIYLHGPPASSSTVPLNSVQSSSGLVQNTGQSYVVPRPLLHGNSLMPQTFSSFGQNSQHSSNLGVHAHHIPPSVPPPLSNPRHETSWTPGPSHRVLPPPPPPPSSQSQGQPMYRHPVPPCPLPPGDVQSLQHIPPPPPAPSTSGFHASTPDEVYLHSSVGNGQVLSRSRPPLPSSPPPIPPSPPPSNSPMTSESNLAAANLPYDLLSDPKSGKLHTSELKAVDSVDQVVASDLFRVAPFPKASGISKEAAIADRDGLSSTTNAISDLPPPPCRPTDDKIVEKIEALCWLIVKNGPDIEGKTRHDECENPEYAFLFGGDPGTEAAISHEYFLWMKRKFILEYRWHAKKSESLPRPLAVDSSRNPDHLNFATECSSAADSDMEMEDDITLSDKDQGLNNTTEALNQPHDEVIEIGGKNQTHKLQNFIENNPPNDILASDITCSGPLGVGNTCEVTEQVFESEKMNTAKAVTKVHSTMDDSVEVVKFPEGKAAAPQAEDLTYYGASDPAVDNPDRDSGQLMRSGSPMRLLQDYVSDDTSDNEDETCFADVSALTVSTAAATSASVAHKDHGSYLETDIGSKISSAAQKGCELLSNISLNESKMSLHLMQEGDVTHTTIASGTSDVCVGHNLENQASVNFAASIEASKVKDVLSNAGIDSSKSGNAEQGNKKTSKLELNPLKVDKFGRVAREDPTDSDSDDSQNHRTRRRNKRDRSWSRSLSPIERSGRRRKRSPWRRKDKRSRSRSWSPRNRRSRSRSRSPFLRRSGEFNGENKRRDKGKCFDFLRGKCYRGASCRYLHHEPDKNASSRRHRNKRDLEVCSKSSRIHEAKKSIYVKVSGDECERVRSQEVEQIKEEDSVKIAIVSAVSDHDSQPGDAAPTICESSREFAPEVRETLAASQELKTVIHDNEASLSQQLLVGGFPSNSISIGDALKLSDGASQDVFRSENGSSVQLLQSNVSVGMLEHSDHPSQIINNSDVSNLLPDGNRLTPCSSDLSNSKPLPCMLPSTLLQSTSSSTSQHLLSEKAPLSSQTSKELSAHSSVVFPLHSYQLPLPPALPHSYGGNSVQPQVSRDYVSVQQNTPFPYQSTRREPYSGMLHAPNPHFCVPPKNPWTSLPPPPPPQFAYSSSLNSGAPTPYVSSESNENKLRLRTAQPSHIQGAESQDQAYPRMQDNSQPLTHVETLSSKPLSQGNSVSQSHSDLNVSKEDHYKQLPMHDSKSVSSPSLASLQSQPKPFSWESGVNRLQTSSYKLPPEEHFKEATFIHPLSQKQQTVYGSHYPAPDGNLGVHGETVTASRYPPDVADSNHSASLPDFGGSRISVHYNPYASTFERPLSSKFSSSILRQENDVIHVNNYGSSSSLHQNPVNGQGVFGFGSRQTTSPEPARAIGQMLPRSGSDQYDPLFDSIEPSSASLKKSHLDQKQEVTGESNISLKPKSSLKSLDVEENKQWEVDATASTSSQNNDEYGETADVEVGAVENESLSNPVDGAKMATGEVEIDQVKSPGKRKKSKDSRSMKLFKVSIANFVKEVLKPSWRQGNMSKVAFKTIVKKTVDKVSGAMKGHRVPKSQAKINQYIDSSQRKLTKLVMGYVDKYVKV